MNAVTQAEFARMEGKARSYITALKNAGRLVLTDDGKVDVEASRARIAGTSDPNRDDVGQRWNEARAPAEKPEAAVDKIGNSFQAARAVGMKYDAMTKKVQYETLVGSLVQKDQVNMVWRDALETLNQWMAQFPSRIGPELVGKDLEQIRATLRQAMVEGSADLNRAFSQWDS